jgi:hypothetical protein
MYATSFAVAFLVIALAQSAKGHDGRYALTQGLLWGAISAAIFVAAAIHRWRRARSCPLCAEPPAAFRGDGDANGRRAADGDAG